MNHSNKCCHDWHKIGEMPHKCCYSARLYGRRGGKK